MEVYLAAAATGLSYVVFPITVVLYYLLLLVVFIGKILYGPINAFLQPFIFIGLSIWWIITFPFHILARLEVCDQIVPEINADHDAAIVQLHRSSSHYWSADRTGIESGSQAV